MNQNTTDEVKGDVLDIRIFCGRYFPFLVIPLSYARIIVSKQIPTAGVNKKGHLIINPTWWSTLTIEAKRFITIHEALHLVLCHPFRAHNFNPLLYNISADGKVNYAIEQTNINGIKYPTGELVTLHSLATITKLQLTDLHKMSTEEITKNLENNNHPKTNQNNANKYSNGFSEDLLSGDFEGEVIQEGDPALSSSSQEKLGDVWRQICEKAKTFAKQAGTLPASFERLVDEVLEVKPPWQITLRFGLQSSLCCDSSFAYPNRRNADLPGHVGYSSTVWCLVDTSGSINQELLKTFLGIIKHEARQVSLRVVAWDAKAYEVLKADRPCEVARKIASKLNGGGGTMCLPVLQKVHKLMNPNDVVIVLTDGDIYDAEQKETKTWFQRVAGKASTAIIGYTHTPIHAPHFQSIFINP
jgi:predicted metal-dependent peptidase